MFVMAVVITLVFGALLIDESYQLYVHDDFHMVRVGSCCLFGFCWRGKSLPSYHTFSKYFS